MVVFTASILAATLISGVPLATPVPGSGTPAGHATHEPAAAVGAGDTHAATHSVTNALATGAAGIRVPGGTNEFSLRAATATDLVEQEYQKLLDDDDVAQEEIDGWIRAADAQPNAVDAAALQRRIDVRLDGIDRRYRDFLERHPEHVEARIAFGSFLNDTGREFPAREQWERARELDPKNPTVYNNLGTTYGHRGPITNALACFEKAVELAPNESLYFHNFATTVYLFRKDVMEYYGLTNEQHVFDKAMALYRRALELDPKNFILASDLAQSYYGIQPPRHEEAIAAWRHAYALASDDLEREGVRVHLARVHVQAGKLQEARALLNNVTNGNYQVLKTRILRNLTSREAGSSNAVPDAVETGAGSRPPGNRPP
ncbi:MAG: tetratricopeptide repeat protein [Verrucomicrobiales bacterium]|nr:tetratricopeptide repeat protein [Verrucomicrobiales bacterium]